MPVRALLVDDEPVILQMLTELMESNGFRVVTAVSAAHAIAALERTEFDVVITDMRMETPTAGFDVIHAASAQANRPVAVILTAYPMPAAQWRVSGADAFFLKTGLMDPMLRDIERMLKQRRRNAS